MSKTYSLRPPVTVHLPTRRVTDAPLPVTIPGIPNGLVWHRRLPPSQLQFTGNVTIGSPAQAGARVVQLRLRGGEVIAATMSDPVTGAFSFQGWFPVRDDYEYVVIGADKVSQVFPISAPAAHRWRGDPSRVSSSDGAPIVQPPDPLIFETHYAPILPNVAYDFTPIVHNGQGALTFSVQGSVPAGLTFNTSTGRLSGTTAATGAYPVTVRATDARGVTGEIVTDFDVGTTFKFWRIFITAGTDGQYTNIQELEYRGTVGGTDLTVPGGAATASSFHDSAHAPASAFDNVIGSATCWTTGSNTPLPAWLAYEFPTRERVVQVAMWPRDSTMARSPTAFQVQVSNRGDVWTTVSSHSNFGAWANSTAKTFLTGL